jgi:hypothetical protein
MKVGMNAARQKEYGKTMQQGNQSTPREQSKRLQRSKGYKAENL